MKVPASDAVVGVDPLEVDDGELIEASVLLVKVSMPDGGSALHRAQTSGMSHWEAMGMLLDALDDARGVATWDG